MAGTSPAMTSKRRFLAAAVKTSRNIRAVPSPTLRPASARFDVLLHLRLEMRYPPTMTKLLDQALEVARGLPSDAQDEIARIVLQLAGNDEAAPLVLSADERAAVALSKAAAERDEFATDEQVRATWAKHGL
jgi:hypothetical protein